MGVGGAVGAGFLMRPAGFDGYRGTAITTMVASPSDDVRGFLERQKIVRPAALRITRANSRSW
jgi:hypothetical protein